MYTVVKPYYSLGLFECGGLHDIRVWDVVREASKNRDREQRQRMKEVKESRETTRDQAVAV